MTSTPLLNGKSLRVLIVGSGSIGMRHHKVISEFFPEAKLAFLKHRIELEGKDNDLPYDISEVENFVPHVAVISNPSPYHLSISFELLKRGCHLIIEKPISISSSEAKALIDFAISVKKVVLVGYNLRYLDSLKCFRELINRGVIGKQYSVRCEVGQFLPNWRPNFPYEKAVSAKKSLGGGVLLELSHEIDYLQWIFGPIKRVSALVRKVSNLNIDTEDIAYLAFEFDRNNQEIPLTGSLTMDFIRHDATRCCTVIGSEGTIKWNGIENTVEYFNGSTKKWILAFKGEPGIGKTYFDQWSHFIELIGSNGVDNQSGIDAVHVLRVIESALLADKKLKMVEVL